ncbi:MAG TPA: ribonuclease HI [Flavisolibacter sp.]|nr:ribonuclease HI [Flavisolibacter sp.]
MTQQTLIVAANDDYIKTKKQMQEIIIYTDGASRGNPGPGGYGTILMYGDKRKELSQGYRKTTNNRMELMAVIAGLEALKKTGLNITIYTDSQYIVKALNEGWLNKWMATNFAKGKKNKDLWVKFYNLYKQHHIKFVWVKGHADNVYNNRCDKLATTAADGNGLLIDEGYEMDPNQLLM